MEKSLLWPIVFGNIGWLEIYNLFFTSTRTIREIVTDISSKGVHFEDAFTISLPSALKCGTFLDCSSHAFPFL